MKQGAASNFAFIEPMKALRVQNLPAGDWLYELKFDGYRALAFKAGKEVRLISRNRTSLDSRSIGTLVSREFGYRPITPSATRLNVYINANGLKEMPGALCSAVNRCG